MKRAIEIVDHGQGMQLSTSRITVQDLVPYLQRGCTCDQIREVMPTLSVDEIQAVERYVRENYDAVMEEDRQIRERNAQRKNSPEVEQIIRRGAEALAALRDELKRSKNQERNGDLARG